MTPSPNLYAILNIFGKSPSKSAIAENFKDIFLNTCTIFSFLLLPPPSFSVVFIHDLSINEKE